MMQRDRKRKREYNWLTLIIRYTMSLHDIIIRISSNRQRPTVCNCALLEHIKCADYSHLLPLSTFKIRFSLVKSRFGTSAAPDRFRFIVKLLDYFRRSSYGT